MHALKKYVFNIAVLLSSRYECAGIGQRYFLQNRHTVFQKSLNANSRYHTIVKLIEGNTFEDMANSSFNWDFSILFFRGFTPNLHTFYWDFFN